MNNADLIDATLKAAGIDRGFGIPSGNVLPLMEAMRKGGVDFVLTAHEGSAGFAADVTGRIKTERMTVEKHGGKVLYTVEHEVRSLTNPLYARPLINRNPDQSNNSYIRGQDGFRGTY